MGLPGEVTDPNVETLKIRKPSLTKSEETQIFILILMGRDSCMEHIVICGTLLAFGT